MHTDRPSTEHHWQCVTDKIAELVGKVRHGCEADEEAVRAEIANCVHLLTNLFELELRRARLAR